MRPILVTLAIGTAIAAGVIPAAAGGLGPGCISEGARDLKPVEIRFRGLEPNSTVVRFYEYLLKRDALPCREVTLGESWPTVCHALTDPKHLAVPQACPSATDGLICALNRERCTKGTPVGTTFVVPDVSLNAHFPSWTSLPLDPDEDPDANLEGVLDRHHYSLPPDVDRKEWLDRIRKANVDFSRSLTKNVFTQKGQRAKQRHLFVPVTEYRAMLALPAAIASTPEKALGLSDFSMDALAPLTPAPRSDANGAATAAPGPMATRFTKALRMISMPAMLPPPGADPSSILIADRGIDTECLFLHPDKEVPAAILAALTGEPDCPLTAHGTHVWGIIGGRVPDIMRGIALSGITAPDISPWDFDKHSPGESPDFFDFVNEAVGAARVANFSFDFQRDLTPSQAERVVSLVQDTPSILYVVPAENRFVKYTRGSQLGLPMALHPEDNVVVVTALSEAGTAVADSAARNDPGGERVVMLAAPGIGIPSACAGNSAGLLSGTSQATAFVSGAAALLARDGLDDSLRVKRRLGYTSDVLPAMVDSVAGGRLNISRALGVREDKICLQANGDGTACDPWISGVAHVGYQGRQGFKAARTVVLKRSGGSLIHEVQPTSRLLRVAKADQGFVVFYLEPDRGRPDRLRREQVAMLEAFADGANHGSLVIRFDQEGVGEKDVPLEELADYVRRGT